MHVDSASNAGGVGIYISVNIEFNHASSYSITVDKCENIWISINTNTSQKYLIGLIYRHPKSNVYEFTAKFNECLQKINGANRHGLRSNGAPVPMSFMGPLPASVKRNDLWLRLQRKPSLSFV